MLQPTIHLDNQYLTLSDNQTLTIEKLHLEQGQHCVVAGRNGSGKSALLAALAGEFEPALSIPGTLEWVSSYQQQAILDAERRKDAADILDVVPVPSLAKDILFGGVTAALACDLKADTVLSRLNIKHVLERPFIGLSTGETRKLLLARAILLQPDWLLLDEPFNGLDATTAKALCELLVSIAQTTTIICATGRWQALPASLFCHCIYMEQLCIQWQSQTDNSAQLKHQLDQLMLLSAHDIALPAGLSDTAAISGPLVELTDGQVSYNNTTVFSQLNWRVDAGQHWQITGPNGAGKSVLLAMICGDDPHCYTNQLTVCGYTRGQGESIWDIKQHIGMVSNSLYLQYRVNCSVRDTLLSGFFDSIGLYQKPGGEQQRVAERWLSLLQLSDAAHMPLQSLSEGDRRLVLIGRAMIKQPALLILDEPCNGLDPFNRQKVLALTALLMRKGSSTVLYVNHHAEDELSDIAHVLDLSKFG